MPNRIIKESICTSKNLDKLTPEEERFFYRLIVNCDDYGRFDARLTILRAKCFPLKIDGIKDSAIEQWLKALEEHQLISIYNVNGDNYLQLNSWEHHQQVRAQRSKYPNPNSELPATANNGNQVKSSTNKSPRNPIQSLSLSLSNIYIVIFNLWNEQGIFVHKKLTDDMKWAIDRALKEHSQGEVSQAIKNYAEILKGEQYYFKYTWTLKDFLKRGLEKFLNIEIARKNYLKERGDGEHQGNTGASKVYTKLPTPGLYSEDDEHPGPAATD